MDPEERFIVHGVQCAVEALVVLILQGARCLGPERLYAVDHVVLIGIHILAVFPLLLLAENHGHCEELAVLVEQRFDAGLLEKLLAVVIDMKDNIRTAVFLLHILKCIFRTAVTAPLHGLRAFFVALGHNVHLSAYHECRVESQAEMADNGVGLVLILLQEVVHTREGDLVDVAVHLLGGHTDTPVADGEGSCLLVQRDTYGQIAHLTLEVTLCGQGLYLLRGIHGVRHHLTQEYLMI